MWLPVETTGAPADEPITLDQAKEWTRVTNDDNDGDLTAAIAAARALVEAQTGTRLVEQTVTAKANCFADLDRLPVAPVISVTSIKYLDTDGAEQTLASSVYEVVIAGRRSLVRLKPEQTWPALYCAQDAVRVVLVVGYETLPDDLAMVLRLLVAQWFENREAAGTAIVEMPNAVRALLANRSTYP